MRRPIPLRLDYDAAQLRRIARESEDADQVRRLLVLAAIYDGASRTQAAEAGGVTLQVERDWVLWLNAEGPEGLIDCKAPVAADAQSRTAGDGLPHAVGASASPRAGPGAIEAFKESS